ncbi:zwei Ig domain protein zig-8-like isoform X2 [Tigriopus californicus]|nr:zwei Ig domain protein zig-8-like isoform X2 [Tigriopus californicus]
MALIHRGWQFLITFALIWGTSVNSSNGRFVNDDGSTNTGTNNSEGDEDQSELGYHPFINPLLSPRVVGVLGKEVRLNCHVTDIGNNTISWIRHRDTHLLSVGRYTYTTDFRFSAQHLPMTHYWQLRIMNVTYEDQGLYECQLSTTPIRSHVIDLKVVEPQTDILGGPDMHVDRGSTINLTCIAKFSPAPPPDVEWYHNGQVISYDSPRGGVSVVTEKGESTSSHLLIQRATAKDSGQYKCVPENTVEAAITLHILKGKNPDAWQTSGGSALTSRSSDSHSSTPSTLEQLTPLLILEFMLEKLINLLSSS